MISETIIYWNIKTRLLFGYLSFYVIFGDKIESQFIEYRPSILR